MTGVSGETATIYVSEPARLRDYFLRLGADASVEDGAVRVRYAGDGSADDTITVYLRNWVERNNLFASILLDPPPPIPFSNSRVEEAPTPPAAPFLNRPRLGDLLQFRGLITTEQLERALAESRASGDLLGRVLIRRRFIFGDELARTLADQLDLPYVNLRVVGYEQSVASLLPSEIGMRFAVLPIGRMGGRVRVAFADPCDDEAKETVRAFVGEFTVVVADLLEIELAWKSIDPSVAVAAVG
jgi:hypothetical protein